VPFLNKPDMIDIIRTDSDNPDFIELVKSLDSYLAIIDGDDHSFYNQFNKTSNLKQVVIAYENGKPMGCGAIREFAPAIMEIKRMYTMPESRNKGIASGILTELENWAFELSCKKMHIRNREKANGSNQSLQKERIQTYSKLRTVCRNGKQRML
jgi:GNAT superfamily N-acetyltransferase